MKVEEIKLAFSNNQKIEFALIDDSAKMNNNSTKNIKNNLVKILQF